MVDHVEMSGTGMVAQAPDVAVVRLAVVHAAPSVADAVTVVASGSGDVLAALDALGVAPGDRQTTSLRVDTRWGQHGPDGYEVEQALTVRVRDVDRLGPVVEAGAAAAGDGFRMHGLEWTLSDPLAAQRRARELAWADAYDKARQLATISGRALGEVLRVRETDGGPTPVARLAKVAMSEAMPTAPGESEMSASLTVRWRLVDPA